MADNPNEFDDEFQFTNLDELESGYDSSETAEQEQTAATSDMSASNFDDGGDLKRNIMIGVAGLFCLFAAYKFLGVIFSGSSKPTKTTETGIIQQKPIEQASVKPQQPAKPVESVKPVASYTPPPPNPQIDRRLSELESKAETSLNSLDSVKNSISGLNNGVDGLNLKINELNKNIAMLSEQIKSQQQQIMLLKRRPKPRKKMVRRVTRPRITYSIQAIIPGRAWLMASNGTTLTVREGSRVPGVGRVKIIDPHQGKVIMNGGRIIKFSPDDT